MPEMLKKESLLSRWMSMADTPMLATSNEK
jgi:hypothetical protein